jgi:hypothetical protein
MSPASLPPVPPGGSARGPAGVQGPSTAGQVRGPGKTDGAAFRALLEELEQRASALEQRSQGDLAPEELADAVDQARSSMERALALSGELLEAWRQHRQQGGTDGAA